MLGLQWTLKLEDQKSVIKFQLLESKKPCHIFSKVAETFFFFLFLFLFSFLKPAHPVQPFIAGFHSLGRTEHARGTSPD